MIKWISCAVLIILTSTIENNVAAQKLTLLKKTAFPHYPSASAVEFYNNRLYVIGDDATQMLVLNNEHEVVDSVSFIKSTANRLSKEIKLDLEALTIITQNSRPHLLAVSSFSTNTRTHLYTFPLHDLTNLKQEREKNIASGLKKAGVKEVNIEGIATINRQLIVSNRANGSNKQNQLLVLSLENDREKVSSHQLINVHLPSTKSVIGISGLAYVPQKDWLLFTASTEDTDNAYMDGSIGESYIGFITNVSQKMQEQSITADKMLPLSPILKSGAQKIESVGVESVNVKEIILHLASDNDNGQSTLFKIRMQL